MRKYYIAFFIMLLTGCGTMTQVEETLKKTETVNRELQTDDRGKNSYSGDPLDNISPVASGNSTIIITVGEKKKPVIKNEQRDTQQNESLESSFSLDYYIKSIPLLGWIIILMVIIGLIITIWIFLKTTMTGKALDASIASGLKVVNLNIDALTKKLVNTDPKTSFFQDLQQQLHDLQQQKAKFLSKQRGIRK